MRLYLGLLVLAACDPVVAHTPDAPTADSSPDAPDHGMVTVKLYDPNNSGAVVVGAPVVFIEADGTQVGHPVTGADGVASADVHAGASLTAVIASANQTMMETLLDLQPGDNIILGPSSPPPTQLGTFTVSFPSYASTSGASYTVYGPCGSTGGGTALSQSLTISSDCKQDPMDITVVARDSAGNAVGYLTKTGVPFVANGSTSLTGTYAGLPQFSATLTNLNAVITSVNLSRSVPDQMGYSSQGGGAPTGGMLSVQAPGPVGAQALVSTSFSTATAQQQVQQRIAGNVQTYGLDAGMTLLPWVNAPTLDVANHKITFTPDTTGTTNDAPDVVFAQTAYSRMGSTSTSFAWLIVGPPAADLTLPLLPVEVGDVMPKATDTTQSTIAAMVESDTFSGYGDVRLDIYKQINSVTDPPHPTAMRVRESLATSR